MEFEEAEAMCELVPEIMTVMEVSAKDNTNVEDTFSHLASELKVGEKEANAHLCTLKNENFALTLDHIKSKPHISPKYSIHLLIL